MFSNYAGAASLVVGLVLPAIVALFSRPSTNPTIKGLAHAVLSLATGFWAVHEAEPQHFYWAPAVVASFLAWVTGTTFYHSLLKKYGWFATLQNTLVSETESRLHISPGTIARYVEDVQPIAEPLAPTSAVTLTPESVHQIATALQAVLHRAATAPDPVPPAPEPTVLLPRVDGLGTRSF
jgi:hypothetical protein